MPFGSRADRGLAPRCLLARGLIPFQVGQMPFGSRADPFQVAQMPFGPWFGSDSCHPEADPLPGCQLPRGQGICDCGLIQEQNCLALS
jgi:hypothetical protein